MGIDTRAAIFVGLPRKEIYAADKSELLESEELEVCPPYYDGNGEDDAICGFELHGTPTYRAREIVFDNNHAEELKAKFKKLTGLEAKVFLSPYVY